MFVFVPFSSYHWLRVQQPDKRTKGPAALRGAVWVTPLPPSDTCHAQCVPGREQTQHRLVVWSFLSWLVPLEPRLVFTMCEPIRRLVVPPPPVGPISIVASLLINISRVEHTVGDRGGHNGSVL